MPLCIFSYMYLFRDVNWAEVLVIPKRFSTETTAAIKSGKLNNKARDEVINALATLMMVHTIKPTSNDYNTICSKLVRAYPLLKDSADSGYVSHCFFKYSVYIYIYIYIYIYNKSILYFPLEFLEEET